MNSFRTPIIGLIFVCISQISSSQFSNVIFEDSIVLHKNNLVIFNMQDVDSSVISKINKYPNVEPMRINENTKSIYDSLTLKLNKYNSLRQFKINETMGGNIFVNQHYDFDEYCFQVIILKEDTLTRYFVNALVKSAYPNWKEYFFSVFDGGVNFQCYGLL